MKTDLHWLRHAKAAAGSYREGKTTRENTYRSSSTKALKCKFPTAPGKRWLLCIKRVDLRMRQGEAEITTNNDLTDPCVSTSGRRRGGITYNSDSMIERGSIGSLVYDDQVTKKSGVSLMRKSEIPHPHLPTPTSFA